MSKTLASIFLSLGMIATALGHFLNQDFLFVVAIVFSLLALIGFISIRLADKKQDS